jgi:hypothetical protein
MNACPGLPLSTEGKKALRNSADTFADALGSTFVFFAPLDPLPQKKTFFIIEGGRRTESESPLDIHPCTCKARG